MNEELKKRFDIIQEALMSVAINYGWVYKYAKFARDNNQSLFVHSLNAFSVAKVIGEELFNLESDELVIGSIGAFLHDYQKAKDSWQASAISFMHGERDFESGAFDHDSGSTKDKGDLKQLLESIEEEIKKRGGKESLSAHHERILNLVVYTHDTENRAMAVKRRSEVGPADSVVPLVRLSDSIASMKEPKDILAKTRDLDLPMNKDVSFEYHELSVIRGLTTSFLNQALISLMKEFGYTPLLYFGKGAAYMRVGSASSESSGIEKLDKLLDEQVSSFRASEIYQIGMVNAVIGPVTQTKWPCLQLVGDENIPEIIRYLSAMPAMNKDTDYPQSKLSSFSNNQENEVARFIKETGSQDKLEILALMYSDFNLFIYVADFLKSYGDFAANEGEQDKYKEHIDALMEENHLNLTYSEISGVSHTSTLELRLEVIEKLWDIGGENLHLRKDRRQVLVDRFISILKKAIQQFKHVAPKLFTEDAKKLLLADIQHYPVAVFTDETIRNLAAVPHDRYAEGKDTTKRICNFCGAEAIEEASATLFGDGSQKFSNYIPGGIKIGGTRKAQVCSLCLVEGMLRAFFFPSAPATTFVTVPDLSLSPSAAAQWAEGVKSFLRTEKVGLSPSSVWNMTRVYTALSRGENIDNASALAALLKPTRSAVNKFAKYLQSQVSHPQKIRYEVVTAQPEPSYEKIAEAHLSGEIVIHPAHLEDFRTPARTQGTAYMTPSHMFIFFRNPLYLDDKESQSTISIRAYLLALIIALVFHARVIIVEGFRPISDLSMQGVVRTQTPAPATMALSSQGISEEIEIHEMRNALKRLASLTLISMGYADGLGKDRLLRLATMNRGAILRRVELENWSKLKQWQKRRLIDLLDVLPAMAEEGADYSQ